MAKRKGQIVSAKHRESDVLVDTHWLQHTEVFDLFWIRHKKQAPHNGRSHGHLWEHEHLSSTISVQLSSNSMCTKIHLKRTKSNAWCARCRVRWPLWSWLRTICKFSLANDNHSKCRVETSIQIEIWEFNRKNYSTQLHNYKRTIHWESSWRGYFFFSFCCRCCKFPRYFISKSRALRVVRQHVFVCLQIMNPNQILTRCFRT